MYARLGPQWASSLPAFLSLACAPLPFLFYRHGQAIRDRCKYSAESQRVWEAAMAESSASAAVQPTQQSAVADGKVG